MSEGSPTTDIVNKICVSQIGLPLNVIEDGEDSPDTGKIEFNVDMKIINPLKDRGVHQGISLINRESSTKGSYLQGPVLLCLNSQECSLPITNMAKVAPIWTQKDGTMQDLVRNDSALVSDINLSFLTLTNKHYTAGNIGNFVRNWEFLTSDKEIISIIKYGLRLRTLKYITPRPPFQYDLGREDSAAISSELTHMLRKNVVNITEIQDGDYFSPIFPRIKKCGDTRVILNLKSLNKSIGSKHFKMESIRNAKLLIRPQCWMASVDLMDAYYSVPIHPEHQNLLKFLWDGTSYLYTCLPNGYRDAMRVFTKIMKPVFGFLRMKGFCSVSYVDDSLLLGLDFHECRENINATVHLLTALGFTVHLKKSLLMPTQHMEFLGFVLNSVDMTITITTKKKDKILNLGAELLEKSTPTIRELARFIGNVVATEEAFPMAPFHYRPMELDKADALEANRGNYDARITLSSTTCEQIHWWVDNIMSIKSWIHPPRIDRVIYSDASEQGWGAESEGIGAHGRWTEEDLCPFNINYLETKAAEFAILSFCKDSPPRHIRLMSDNTTTVAYINHQGGSRSPSCDGVARRIWKWAENNDTWISAAHIPGKDNIDADEQSRAFNDATEWSISDFIFRQIVDIWGDPDIDLFATRINCKIPMYVSWKPDPGCQAVDAFSFPWNYHLAYCFPPFSMVMKTISKIQRDQQEAILIVPLWHTQTWFPVAMKMVTDLPIVFSARHLWLPNKPNAHHPLESNLKLVALRLSASRCNNTNFLQRLKRSSWGHGERAHNHDTLRHWGNGNHFVSQKTLIPYIHL